MRELLSDEVDAVSGAWAAPLAGAALGAVSGAAMYSGAAMTSGARPSASGLVTAVVAGAASGAVYAPASALAARALLAPQVGVYAGMTGGAAYRGYREIYRMLTEPGYWNKSRPD